MPKQNINDLITRTGPGQPTGDEVLGRYWQPAPLSEGLVRGGSGSGFYIFQRFRPVRTQVMNID